VERVALPTAVIRIADHRVWSETLFAYASAFQPTLSTALQNLGAQLHSSSLGRDRA
jgi:hypothetical protein